MKENILPILVAEDQESDQIILRLAFTRAGLINPVVIVRDGQEVLDYLSGSPPYSDRTLHPLPVLLILDLKMPRMNGFDVLTWLGGRDEFKKLPVFVLSSSFDDLDITKARQMGAWDYYVKPHLLSDFVEIIHGLQTRCPILHPENNS